MRVDDIIFLNWFKTQIRYNSDIVDISQKKHMNITIQTDLHETSKSDDDKDESQQKSYLTSSCEVYASVKNTPDVKLQYLKYITQCDIKLIFNDCTDGKNLIKDWLK